ncbi:hypothetical protein ILYODFUR_004065 [Ilyodon furcidens]|uniref:Secreted protein n=1 Tax=Ilyodon furcidens TaxID=33524 RepID=A0ABV0UH91_9TELE
MAYRVQCVVAEDILSWSFSVFFHLSSVLLVILSTVPNICCLCQTRTQSRVLSFPAVSRRCAHEICVYVCVCFLTELGSVEKQPPECSREQIGV